MSAFTRSKITLLALTATLAVAQDRSDPIPPSRDTGPQVITRVEPNFPNVPRREPVTLLVSVDSKGQATKIRVMNSHDRGVDEAAIAAVQKWLFKAGTKNGLPVDSTTVVSFPVN
jgi:TonB family protein